MPVLCKTDAYASTGPTDDSNNLAFRGVGIRPRRSSAERTRRLYKFSKWIEVCPLANIKSEQAAAFFTDIIHRFGAPNSIIIGNITQFIGKKFLSFCSDHHIRVD
jgi:hypothetical protein